MNIRMITFVAVFAALVVRPVRAEQADFYILRNPADFTIYDMYEQSLDNEELSQLGAGVPFRVVEKDVVLGDQISHGARLELFGKNYSLAKNDNGTFVGEKASSRTTVKSASILNDTIVVTAGRAATLLSVTGESIPLSSGTSLIRIFSSGSRWYVARRGSPSLYGWIPQLSSSAWKRGSSRPAITTELSDERVSGLMEKIAARFSTANETYRTFFDHFNTQTGSQKTIPQWTCISDGTSIRATLNQPYARTGELDASTGYLVRDIENLLLGSMLRVSYDSGELLVLPKETMGRAQ